MNRNTRFLVLILLIALLGVALFYLYSYIQREQAPTNVVVCIDPGHPSEVNSGRTPQHGTNETEINWQVALKLEDILAKDKRIRVIKTREVEDQLTRNYQRAVIANDADAAITVHLHCDAGPSHGYTIYYPDRVGLSGCRLGPSPKVIQQSCEAAKDMHTAMKTGLDDLLRDRGVRGDSKTHYGSKFGGGLTTSIWSEVPTLTIEMVFLNNRSDAQFIKGEAGQMAMADAIADGIKQFIRPELDKLGERE